MSKNDDIFRFDRRSFLKRSGTAGLTATGLFHAITQLRLIDRAVAAGSGMTSGQLDGYKALVCIFLRGGCDMNNMLVPIGGNVQKGGYKDARGVAGVPELITEEVLVGTPPAPLVDSIERAGTQITSANDNGFGTEYGLHSSCSNMKEMFDLGQMGFVTNVGTLVEPIPLDPTQTQYNNAVKPIQLFSHSDQVNEHMSGNADSPFVSGWGGRVANILNDTYNLGTSQTSMLISLAGNNDFMVAGGNSQINQFSVTTSGPISLVNLDPASGNADNARRGAAYQAILNYPYSHVFERGYTSTVNSAIANEATLGEALEFTEVGHANYLGVDMIQIFLDEFGETDEGNLPGTARELLMIARLIAGRRCLGNQRQIFFCDQGGYDTHQDINADQPGLLRELDQSIGAFNRCLRALDISHAGDPDITGKYGPSTDAEYKYNQVTGFQMSDFNRTWTPNGDDPIFSGTDHAWGTHKFVFGGAVETQQGGSGGGRLYGAFPELAVGGENDVPGNNNRGRWIPSTSTDAYAARLANWFDIDQSTIIGTLFPNLPNFSTTPFDAGANLDFLPTT